MTAILKIGDRRYMKNDSPGVYEVPLGELVDLRLGDIPQHSSVHITELQKSADGYHFYLSVTNGGDEGDNEYLDIFGCVGLETGPNPARKISRLRRVYLPFVERGDLPDPLVMPKRDSSSHGAGFSMNFADRPNVVVKEAIRPMLSLFEKLSVPEMRVFVCHASEDKPAARDFASRLSALGAEVWLDEWEIRVGDSIVDKINAGLESASHLAVLLSVNSVTKPWVKREFSATLMRQLADSSVTTLPVRLDNCAIPAVLSDIKYADCRESFERGINQIAESLFLPTPSLPPHVRDATA
jgi:hypothetical protein